MLDNAKETYLGHKKGAQRQFRYGNLHIREYQDKYLVHMDKVNPHDDPLGHLIYDAQEVIIGLASGAIGGAKIASYFYKKSQKTKKDKQIAAAAGLVSSLLIGYAGYTITKKLKGQ
jgi:phosphotransferase system  glucose/maltose/N-acetylglucosamine-specific IIC component